MTHSTTTGPSDRILRYLLMGELLFIGMVFFLVFGFNWEDWFFGMKIEGTPAGAYLFLKGVVAILLLCLVLKFPRRIRISAYLALAYYGFLFLDSSVTIRHNTEGTLLFSFPLAALMLVPLSLVIFRGPLEKPEIDRQP